MSLPALFRALRFNSRSVKPIFIKVSIFSSIVNRSVDVDEDETIEHEIFSLVDDDDAVELLQISIVKRKNRERERVIFFLLKIINAKTIYLAQQVLLSFSIQLRLGE